MASLVEIIGMTHNPFLPRLFEDPQREPALVEASDDYASMRDALTRARPDVLVVVASDHLNQWFLDNMPPFLIGKAPYAEGPFHHEMRSFGLAPYRADIDIGLAEHMVADGSRRGVDFAFSSGEFRIDHAFTVPLNFVRPEMDLPIVPVWTNVMAPPVPTSQRFYEVGRTIREVIETMPGDQRVGVVSSGHLAIELGGPKTSQLSSDVEFDRHMMELITSGDAATVVKEASWERLMQAGNVAAGFLNYVLLMGIADGAAPTSTAVRFPETCASVPYVEWSLANGSKQ